MEIRPEIKIENTPNPATLVFRMPQTWAEGPLSLEFTTAQDAEASPLASKIFGFPWTQSVFLGPDFISITKQDWVDWDFLSQPLADLIADHVVLGLPIYDPQAESLSSGDPDDPPIVRDIKALLDREIRPAVAYDGGDVVFSKFEDNKLYVQFKGACAGCPSRSITLKDGIESRIRESFPGITEVIGI